jgi:hypothetical protein
MRVPQPWLARNYCVRGPYGKDPAAAVRLCCEIIRARRASNITFVVALAAFEFDPDPLFAFRLVEHPWTRFERRPMTKMLMVPARKQRSPVAFFIGAE